MSEVQSVVTEAQWNDARIRRRRASNLMAVLGLVVVSLLALPLMLLTEHTASGSARYPVAVGWLALMMVPVAGALWRRSVKEQERSDDVVASVTRELSLEIERQSIQTAEQEALVRHQEFESRLANALDMAEGEPEVIDVIERSLAITLPRASVELLLADNSHAHLLRMASSSPVGAPPDCSVDSPDQCPAARRATVQHFPDSEALDSCPKLRGRESGAVSALCMPVSIMGRTVGVIHATKEQHSAFANERMHDLGTLAKLAGARIGLLRVMAETQLQAATDSLTGLLNRRSFEERLSAVRLSESEIVIAMSDLDHFKSLNDTYGHDAGDRALRVFSQVLRKAMRANDLVCRHGGEEFVVALPSCSPESAREILDSVRTQLQDAITAAGLTPFTVSFGLVAMQANEELPTAISRADAALFEAKREGRDQVVLHDGFGNSVPVSEHSANRGLKIVDQQSS